MTQTRPARRRSRRRAVWAGVALAVAATTTAPTAAGAATPSSAGTGAGTPATGTPTSAGCVLPVSTTTPSPTGSPTGGTTTGGGGATDASGTLAWAPPRLTSPATIHITSRTRSLKLDQRRDYVLDLPSTAVHLDGGLRVWGGHDVVLIGGQIDASGGRAMYLHGQTGTVHVEGVRVTGKDVHEGINVAEFDPRATVQIENVKIDRVNGSYRTHHADLLQVWAGPSNLRVDRFEGSSTYQGFFFQPTQFTKRARPDVYDLRHVVLRDASARSAYLLWQSDRFPIRTQDVTVVRNPGKGFPAQVMWPKNGKVWSGVTEGSRTTPSPLTGDPGTAYRSPGYAAPGSSGTSPRA